MTAARRDPGRILILGAGPTGLGAAHRLVEAGHPDWMLLEARAEVGGLAASYLDARGFTWDFGVHVHFSHYARYDRALDRALGDAWLWHDRGSWIRLGGRFVPYPFQNNLHHLEPEALERALDGLARRADGAPRAPANFAEWIDAHFGEGIAELFMRPYNLKVWGYPLEALGTGWVGERVAIPDLETVRRAVTMRRDEVNWGPNRRYRYPLRGGTGAIWRALAAQLPADRVRTGARVVAIDLERRTVVRADGGGERWDHLVSSLPLDRLIAICTGLPEAVAAQAQRLRKSAVHAVGVGLRGALPTHFASRSWIYFPETQAPFYRLTVLSNLSPHNAPSPDCWSLLAEVSETPDRPVDHGRLAAAVVTALRRDGLLPEGSEVVSLWHRREEYGYPTPAVDRDAALEVLQRELARRGVLSRGRFGAWRYEISNQDHCHMQGVEAVERLLGLGDEPTLERSDWVNSGALAAPALAPQTVGRLSPED